MNKKETLEFLRDGLKEQFTELGKEIGIDGNSANVAKARLETIVTILALEQLIEEDESKVLKNTKPNLNIGGKLCSPINNSYRVTGSVNLENISTDDLVKEISRRKGIVIVKKISNLDDGAVG